MEKGRRVHHRALRLVLEEEEKKKKRKRSRDMYMYLRVLYSPPPPPRASEPNSLIFRPRSALRLLLSVLPEVTDMSRSRSLPTLPTHLSCRFPFRVLYSALRHPIPRSFSPYSNQLFGFPLSSELVAHAGESGFVAIHMSWLTD